MTVVARQDVVRFVKDSAALNIWSQDYFLQLAGMMRIDGVAGSGKS